MVDDLSGDKVIGLIVFDNLRNIPTTTSIL